MKLHGVAICCIIQYIAAPFLSYIQYTVYMTEQHNAILCHDKQALYNCCKSGIIINVRGIPYKMLLKRRIYERQKK